MLFVLVGHSNWDLKDEEESAPETQGWAISAEESADKTDKSCVFFTLQNMLRALLSQKPPRSTSMSMNYSTSSWYFQEPHQEKVHKNKIKENFTFSFIKEYSFSNRTSHYTWNYVQIRLYYWKPLLCFVLLCALL